MRSRRLLIARNLRTRYSFTGADNILHWVKKLIKTMVIQLAINLGEVGGTLVQVDKSLYNLYFSLLALCEIIYRLF